MKATLLLCDHAQVAEGKLFISGGGWSVTGPGPISSAIAVLILVPWDRANSKVSFVIRLLQEDGQPVQQPGPVGPVAVEIGGEFEVGRPPGVKPGTPLDVPLAINIPPLVLPPDQRFSWELSIDGETDEDWHLSFSTRPIPTMTLGGLGPGQVPPLGPQ